MGFRLKIRREVCGTWSVGGLSPLPVEDFPGLADAITYGGQECGAAPATIELLIDGFYAVIHQERGWPRRLLAPETDGLPPTCLATPPISSRLLAWLKGPAPARRRYVLLR